MLVIGHKPWWLHGYSVGLSNCLHTTIYELIEFPHTEENSNADCLSGLPQDHLSAVGYAHEEPAVFNINQVGSLPVTSAQLATSTCTDCTLCKVYTNVSPNG